MSPASLHGADRALTFIVTSGVELAREGPEAVRTNARCRPKAWLMSRLIII